MLGNFYGVVIIIIIIFLIMSRSSITQLEFG